MMPARSVTTGPQAYRPGELRELKAVLEERWPKLDQEDAWRWLGRWIDGRSPYSRVRSHLVRCQLDAIIALALHCGLRSSEIFRLTDVWMHDDNFGVVVWDATGPPNGVWREVPYTDRARGLVAPWCRIRSVLKPQLSRQWLNLHADARAREPMTRASFDRLMRTHLGDGWTLKRLRDTCAAAWIRAGLPLEHLRQLLGLSRIEDTLPYARLIGGRLDGQMEKRDEHFAALVAGE